ncbi:MAG: acyltransferase [Lachnospiraceae bacterium]|nr:acyltransferase [Lachnospiraceae bacterium]
MSITKDQGEKIQIMRGLCIVAVVFIHVCFGSAYDLYISALGNYCVGSFLFLSGFFTYEKRVFPVGKFYKKRGLRILVPYLLWSLIYTAYSGDFSGFFYKLLTGQCCSIYYYIIVYLQLILLTPLLVKIMKTKLWWIILCISPFGILGEYMIALKTDYLLIYPWNINNFVVWISYYYIGVLIVNKSLEKKVTSISWMGVIGMIVVAGGLSVFEARWWLDFGREDFATTPAKLSVFLWTLSVLLVLLKWMSTKNPKEINFGWKVLKYIGDASFGIYLVHQLIIQVLGQWGVLRFHRMINYLLVMGVSFCIVWGLKSFLVGIWKDKGKQWAQWIGCM